MTAPSATALCWITLTASHVPKKKKKGQQRCFAQAQLLLRLCALCVHFIQGHLVTLPNSQKPCELRKKKKRNNRKRQPWYIQTPGPKRALAHVPPTPGISKSWAWLHKGCVGPTLKEHFLYISCEMQQTTGYVISPGYETEKGRALGEKHSIVAQRRVWKYLLPYKYRGSSEDEVFLPVNF